ncbi:MAG TPA: hypothetical protein VL961_01615 [Acidimicrobiales bacterium]|nr:hypothetical protein [Acidimicrobiales bacterium]
MTTTVDSATGTPVAIGGPRGGPDTPTLRSDSWWVEPVVTVAILTAFVVYSTWAAFVNKDYYAGAALHRNLLSPFYSPCVAGGCVTGSHPFGVWIGAWTISPALLILIFPLGFRLTCYYYRKAYYRAFWWSPPACAVADAHGSYSGETRLPLILQNVHRFFFWILLLFNCVLTIDAIEAFRFPGQGIGISVGTVVLCLNAVFLWLYSLSCHACRHFCGGQVKSFAKHPIRHRLWKFVTPLNANHMKFAWISLFGVAICDLYVRLVASGVFTDPGFHF